MVLDEFETCEADDYQQRERSEEGTNWWTYQRIALEVQIDLVEEGGMRMPVVSAGQMIEVGLVQEVESVQVVEVPS